MTHAFDETAPLGGPALSVPSENACAVAAFVLIGTTGFCAIHAVVDTMAPVILASPFFLGAIVGLVAIRRPVRTLLLMALLALAGFVIAADTAEAAAATAVLGAFVLAFASPLAIIGAVCTATIRRRLRASEVLAS